MDIKRGQKEYLDSDRTTIWGHKMLSKMGFEPMTLGVVESGIATAEITWQAQNLSYFITHI